MDTATPRDDQPRHEKLFGNGEYQAALDRLLMRPQRRLCVFDRQLGKAFNSAARCELLQIFLLKNRASLRIVLHDASTLMRDCPRLINLVSRFAHAIAIHETEPHAKGAYDPFAMADERDHLHRFHYDDSRALLVLDDPQATLIFAERFEELWTASAPAAPATTLGL